MFVVLKQFCSQEFAVKTVHDFLHCYKQMSVGQYWLPSKGNPQKPSYSMVGLQYPLFDEKTSEYIDKLLNLPSYKDRLWLSNYREYKGNTTDVNPHHDGLYYGLSDSEYHTFSEGILSPYTMILVVTNENLEKEGTYLVDKDDLRIDLQASAGDLIVFDNIKYRHGVHALEKTRSMIATRPVTGLGCWLGIDGVPNRPLSIEETASLYDKVNLERLRERIKG